MGAPRPPHVLTRLESVRATRPGGKSEARVGAEEIADWRRSADLASSVDSNRAFQPAKRARRKLQALGSTRTKLLAASKSRQRDARRANASSSAPQAAI